ncbi:glycosidase PH1107-related protein [Methanothermus fervidus DSM 2088]|uniref:Glycosidase PH1107-related protein n=1 Tax=Methanothermus fervidus (strain ATCC 43054 / DSM 2088 / JCM 10308 / V24 S) TaxID=523846 RepID=E3GYX5_METFV|nr:glycosidase PH1107-related protein [Methanothermus fervidus DSM 2088]
MKKNDKIYFLYRAMTRKNKNGVSISQIGIAESYDGISFHKRRLLITPDTLWDCFGCEDPRVTKLNNKYYVFYTALSHYPPRPDGIRVGLAITKNFKKIDKKYLITHFNAKAMALFPEKINGKIWAILTVHTDLPPAKICLASFNNEKEIWSREYWYKWYQKFEDYSLPLQRSSDDHIEVGTPPLKTPYGWLLIYSYIKNYFSEKERLFTVEAVLLDLKNPFKIISRTNFPILIPEEYYEKTGIVSDVIFPSGAFIKNNVIYLYYGAADTTCCLAFIDLPFLIKTMKHGKIKMKRAAKRPIITPIIKHKWESKATFNPGAIYLNGEVHIIYRALSEDNTSVFGYAKSKDGINIDYRSSEPIYTPKEPFENKKFPDAASGCEDPRLTIIDDKIYMLYTAFDGEIPRVAMTSIDVNDFLEQNWKWAKAKVISPLDIPDKNACIFPEKYAGKYIIVHRLDDSIHYSLCEDLNIVKELDDNKWISPRKSMWDCVKVGIAAPPIKTNNGWILFYHGVDKNKVYRVGALLLELDNPLKIIRRSMYPILEPEMWYERWGIVPNVVFPCGAVKINKDIYLYYGAADTVVGVAKIKINDLFWHLGVKL